MNSKELAKHSPVPVLNALSSLWHPTQILADLLTLYEHSHLFQNPSEAQGESSDGSSSKSKSKDKGKFAFKGIKNDELFEPRSLTVAYVGDSANVLHDMLVTYPRLGHKLRVATPADPKYRAPEAVWKRVVDLHCDKGIWWGTDPKEAVHGADVVVTDTW